MFNKIIGLNNNTANFLKASSAVAKLILEIQGSDNITKILKAIKDNPFSQEEFFIRKDGLPTAPTKIRKGLLASTNLLEEKRILRNCYTLALNYEPKTEQTLSEWLIFAITQNHCLIYKELKRLIDDRKLSEATQLLELHKEAIYFSKILFKIQKERPETLKMPDGRNLFYLVNGLIAYQFKTESLIDFVNKAKAFLKRIST